jgi:hypothetical protein
VVGWLLVFRGQEVAVRGSPRLAVAVACQMDQPNLSPKVEQEVASQVKTDRGHWEPEEARQMDSRFHQAEAEVPRVLGFRKTDLCQLDLVVRVGAEAAEAAEAAE